MFVGTPLRFLGAYRNNIDKGCRCWWIVDFDNPLDCPKGPLFRSAVCEKPKFFISNFSAFRGEVFQADAESAQQLDLQTLVAASAALRSNGRGGNARP